VEGFRLDPRDKTGTRRRSRGTPGTACISCSKEPWTSSFAPGRAGNWNGGLSFPNTFFEMVAPFNFFSVSSCFYFPHFSKHNFFLERGKPVSKSLEFFMCSIS